MTTWALNYTGCLYMSMPSVYLVLIFVKANHLLAELFFILIENETIFVFNAIKENIHMNSMIERNRPVSMQVQFPGLLTKA